MTQTNKEVKFKYYPTPSARINDNAASDNDIAFVKNGGVGEIYAKGYRFGMGAVSGDITVDDITAQTLTVDRVSGSQVVSSNATQITPMQVKINSDITGEYIKFTAGGLEYREETEPVQYGQTATPATPVTLSWATLINNISAAGNSQTAPQVSNIGWSDFSSALQSHLLYIETESSNNVDERASISGTGGTLDLGSGSWKLTGSSSGYPKVQATAIGVSYWANSNSSLQYKTWADITSANQAGTLYWYEESAS